MARQTVTTDDVDGSPDARTLTFSYDGQRYEIDLSPENQEKFRQALAPFLANSRVVESPPPAPNAPTGMLRRLRRSRATSPGASTDEKPPTGRRPPASRLRFLPAADSGFRSSASCCSAGWPRSCCRACSVHRGKVCAR